jgi:hypothetical protein
MKFTITNFCKEIGKNRNIFIFRPYLTKLDAISKPETVYFKAKEQEYTA